MVLAHFLPGAVGGGFPDLGFWRSTTATFVPGRAVIAAERKAQSAHQLAVLRYTLASTQTPAPGRRAGPEKAPLWESRTNSMALAGWNWCCTRSATAAPTRPNAWPEPMASCSGEGGSLESALRASRHLVSGIFLQTMTVCPVLESIRVVTGSQRHETVFAFSCLLTTQCSITCALGGGITLRTGAGGGAAG
jgi:hypothetical protein